MHLDQKVTIWQRVHFKSETDMKKAVEMLENDTEATIVDICDAFNLSSENLFETEIMLYPNDNEGYSTLEIHNDKEEIVYENGSTN